MSRSGIVNAELGVIQEEFFQLSAELSKDTEKLLAARAAVEAALGMLFRHQIQPTEVALDFRHLIVELNTFHEFISTYDFVGKKAAFHVVREKAKKALSKDDPRSKEFFVLIDRKFSAYYLSSNNSIPQDVHSIFQALYDLSVSILDFCKTNNTVVSDEVKSVLHATLALFSMMSRVAVIKNDHLLNIAYAERSLHILVEMNSVDALRLSIVDALLLLFNPENIFANISISPSNQEALFALSWALIRGAIKEGLSKTIYQAAFNYCIACSRQERLLGVVMRSMLSLQTTDANDARMLTEFLGGMHLNSFLMVLAKNSMKTWKVTCPMNESYLGFVHFLLDRDRVLLFTAYRYLRIVLTDFEMDYARSGLDHALPVLITQPMEVLPDDHAVKKIVRALLEKEDYVALAKNTPEQLEGFDSINYAMKKRLGDWKGCAAIVEEKIRSYLLEKYAQDLGLTFGEGKSTSVFPTAKIQAAVESIVRAEQGASTEASLADLKQHVIATGLEYIKKHNVLVSCDGIVSVDNAGLKTVMEKTIEAGAYQAAILSQKDSIVTDCTLDVLSRYKSAYDDRVSCANAVVMMIFQDGKPHPQQRARVAVYAILNDAASILSEQNKSGIIQILFSDQSILAIQREVEMKWSVEALLSQDDKAMLQAIVVGTAIFTGLAEDKLTHVALHLLTMVYGRDIQALNDVEKSTAKMLVDQANAVIGAISIAELVPATAENREQHRFDCATSVAYLMGKNEFVLRGGYRHEFLMKAARGYLSAVNTATETEMDNNAVEQLTAESVDKAVCRFVSDATLTL